MKLLAGGVATALLLPLLAPYTEATAGPGEAPTAPARRSLNLASESTPEPQEERTAGPENGSAGDNLASSWYRMLPGTPQAEPQQAEPDYIAGLKESLEAVKGQVSKINPEQIREAAVAQLSRLRLPPVLKDQNIKLPLFVQRLLNDPELRRHAGLIAMGVAGMAAAGFALGDLRILQELTLISLYVAALVQVVRGGAQLLGKLSNELSQSDAMKKSDVAVRQQLAKMLGIRPELKSEAPDEQ